MTKKSIKLLGTLLTLAFVTLNLSLITGCKPSKSSKSFDKGMGKRLDKAKKEHKFD